jgi:hypothetical protein
MMMMIMMIIIIIIITHEWVINVNGTTGMWDVPVITDLTVPANRPDTVGLLHDKTEDLPADRYSLTRRFKR